MRLTNVRTVGLGLYMHFQQARFYQLIYSVDEVTQVGKLEVLWNSSCANHDKDATKVATTEHILRVFTGRIYGRHSTVP